MFGKRSSPPPEAATKPAKSASSLPLKPPTQQQGSPTMADNESTAFRPEIARRSATDLPSGLARPAAAPATAAPSLADDKKLIVGRHIVLSGQITACDKLIVEGRVEATLTDCKMIEIASSGVFKGEVEIDEAMIGGHFEGKLVCRGRLFIRSTGKVKGEIRYGQLEIECGGEMVGSIGTVEGGARIQPEPKPATPPFGTTGTMFASTPGNRS